MTFDNYSFGLDSDAGAALGGTFAQTRESVMSGGNMDFYRQLGQQLLSAMQPPAQQAQEEMPFSRGSLTEGFNMNWLSERLVAGSANGAKISGMLGGGGMMGGK